MMKPSPELIRLVEKSFSKQISSEENIRLELLLKDEEAMAYYLDMASLEAGLATLTEECVQPSNVVPFIRRFSPVLISAAAAVLFLLGFLSGKMGGGEEVTPAIVEHPVEIGSYAQVTSMVGVDWDGVPSNLQLEKGSKAIKLKAGLVEITFDSGVKALVEGPAEIQVTGKNEAYVGHGKLVAEVPKGAEGFTVNYDRGRLVDLGTEFAMDIQAEKPVEVGVFRGEVEVYTDVNSSPVKIIENHAVMHGASLGDSIKSIPFVREKYIRELPTSEFSWKFPENTPHKIVIKKFNVSHLVWKSGDYKAVMKWMDGRHSVNIKGAELYCDGELVALDAHAGSTGLLKHTSANSYKLHVPEGALKRGHWVLKMKLKLRYRPDEEGKLKKADSKGLLMFEEVSKIRAKDSDFVGKWEYLHDGDIHTREFHADHTASYSLNGKKTHDFSEATWRVEDNVLILNIPARPDLLGGVVERHMLRGRKELIFETRPYRNSFRVK